MSRGVSLVSGRRTNWQIEIEHAQVLDPCKNMFDSSTMAVECRDWGKYIDHKG